MQARGAVRCSFTKANAFIIDDNAGKRTSCCARVQPSVLRMPTKRWPRWLERLWLLRRPNPRNRAATIAARSHPSCSCATAATLPSFATPSASLAPGLVVTVSWSNFFDQPTGLGMTTGQATRKRAARCRSSAKQPKRKRHSNLAPRATSVGCSRRRCLRARRAKWRTTAARSTSTTPGSCCLCGHEESDNRQSTQARAQEGVPASCERTGWRAD